MSNVKIAKIMKDNNIGWSYHCGLLWAKDQSNTFIVVSGWSLKTINNWLRGR